MYKIHVHWVKKQLLFVIANRKRNERYKYFRYNTWNCKYNIQHLRHYVKRIIYRWTPSKNIFLIKYLPFDKIGQCVKIRLLEQRQCCRLVFLVSKNLFWKILFPKKFRRSQCSSHSSQLIYIIELSRVIWHSSIQFLHVSVLVLHFLSFLLSGSMSRTLTMSWNVRLVTLVRKCFANIARRNIYHTGNNVRIIKNDVNILIRSIHIRVNAPGREKSLCRVFSTLCREAGTALRLLHRCLRSETRYSKTIVHQVDAEEVAPIIVRSGRR